MPTPHPDRTTQFHIEPHMTTYTIVVLRPGATRLVPVGPTSEEPGILPLKKAREQYELALVVPWEERLLSKEDALARVAAMTVEREKTGYVFSWERVSA